MTTQVETAKNPLKIGDKVFRSRLIVGTGKYQSFEQNREALEISGAEMITVAVRRIELDKTKDSILNFIDPKKYTLLPNTAGCYTVEEAVMTANWHAKPDWEISSRWRSSATRKPCSPTTRPLWKPPKYWCRTAFT